MAAWDACTQEPNSWLRWIECHPGLAGYLQALGVILAVVIAFLSPQIAGWYAKRQRRVQILQNTRDLVGGLETPAIDVGVVANRIKLKLDQHKNSMPDALIWKDWFEKEIFLPLSPQFEFLYQQLEGTNPVLMAPYVEISKSIVSYNSVRFQTKDIPLAIAEADWFNVWRGLNDALDRVHRAVFNAGLQYIPPQEPDRG